MSKLIVSGGNPLYGVVKLGGAKNASYKLMIASLLGNKESRFLNIPNIADVGLVKNIINDLGGKAYTAGENTIFVDPRGVNSFVVPEIYGKTSRASSIFVGPLLAKFKQAIVPMPGGDKIGKRPLDRHLTGLEKMGVKREQQGENIRFYTDGLQGIHYRFEKNTHTGTETLLMAAVLAKGKTILENAALEPEVDDLIKFLNKMGARIRRKAFKVIEIDGVDNLDGAIHYIMPDRNEAVTYACAAIATKGDIVIENARAQDLQAFLDKLDEAGGGYEVDDYGIRFYYKGPLRGTDIETKVHPGFMTDRQALWATLMCTANGESIIHETIFPDRFRQYVDVLTQMGAKFELFNPDIDQPEKLYNFNRSERKQTDRHAIRIFGPVNFTGGDFCIDDLRAGATILVASMGGSGKTIINNIEQIERGYDNIAEKLVKMGANIIKVE